MAACEKCWSDACVRAMTRGDHYRKILEERQDHARTAVRGAPRAPGEGPSRCGQRVQYPDKPSAYDPPVPCPLSNQPPPCEMSLSMNGAMHCPCCDGLVAVKDGKITPHLTTWNQSRGEAY